jgi:hypothetical protein
MHFAYIYELRNWKPRRIDKFERFPGNYLLTPLVESTAYIDLGRSGIHNGQIIQFFTGIQASTRTFAVVYLEGDLLPDEAVARGFLATRVGSTRFDLQSRVTWISGNSNQYVDIASMFLRNSHSLAESEFQEIGKLKVVADAKGMAVFDSTISNLPQNDRFIRVCHLVTLCSLRISARQPYK